MNMNQALDKAARATAELEALIAHIKKESVVEALTTGASGEYGGDHQGNIGVHPNVPRADAEKIIGDIQKLAHQITEKDVSSYSSRSNTPHGHQRQPFQSH